MTREKIDRVKVQLSELLTHYGEITALVIDGWNAAWSRLNYEEMPFLEIYNHVKRLQPLCLTSDYNQAGSPRRPSIRGLRRNGTENQVKSKWPILSRIVAAAQFRRFGLTTR